MVCNQNPEKLFVPKKDKLRGQLMILYNIKFLGSYRSLCIVRIMKARRLQQAVR
jgi:hypothetical protein